MMLIVDVLESHIQTEMCDLQITADASFEHVGSQVIVQHLHIQS